jgi:membrane-associated phospholipid phosphatase
VKNQNQVLTHLFLKILTVLLGFSLLALIFILKLNPIFHIDLNATLFLQRLHSVYLDNLMILISLFGYGWFKYLVLVLISFALYFKRFVIEAWILFFATAGADLVSSVIKVIVARPRPDPNLIHQLGEFVKKDSFPSGHVVFYTAFFGFLILLLLKVKNKMLKRIGLAVCLFLIILVGPSRMYLGAHWLSDVTGGYFIGLLWLIISVYVYGYWKAKNEK